jgi:threonine aldolase
VAKPTPRTLDFRSDTVTQPTDAMRKAMAEAEVGDDLYGEDPTVARLQERAAKLLGMEAAMFVPSGTMGNQIAVWMHTQRRGAVLAEEYSHIAYYEGGAASLLSGAMVKTIHSPADGTFTPAQMAEDLDAPRDFHFQDIRLVAVEDTYQFAGGTCWPLDKLAAVRDAAHRKGVRFHIDGARIFNAAIAQGVPASKLCKGTDSVMFCVSKGLSAPVGSLLCGSRAFVEEAKTVRKALGGGMRQSGHLAAAGLVALDTGIERLADDHANAKRLAKGLADLPGVKTLGRVETNMVMVDVSGTKGGPAGFVAGTKKAGVLCGERGKDGIVRFVTHRNVSGEDVALALERLEDLLA